jgi:hypothetical protein
MNNQTVINSLLSVTFEPESSRPNLLFSRKEMETIRHRAEAHPSFLPDLKVRCAVISATSPQQVDFEVARPPAVEALTLAQGYALGGPREWAEWSKARIFHLLDGGTWIPPVHQSSSPIYDHVTGQVAAALAYTHDLLDNACTSEETRRIEDGMRRRVLLPFLAATRTRTEWWSRAETDSNWKIMTCGETGFALCGYARQWPDSREALGYAARGVLETLDGVAPEGDWPEGVGYWMATLFMGLRFARALRRLTDGAINLMEHPALQKTGDFALYLTSNRGRVFNFNDNQDTLNYEAPSDCIRLLATETGRSDLKALGRSYPHTTLLSLALEDTSTEPAPRVRGAKLAAVFPRTGVATLRSGWECKDSFIGFKCGPSDVGHSHLDANSFVLEAQGESLLVDSGYWRYAAFIGFFDFQSLRWNWDNNATVGHSSLLVDGQGQTWGKEHFGRLGELRTGDGWQMISGDASRCYPNLLTQFIRTVCLLGPHHVVIRDVIRCATPRQVEWLLHYAGQIRDEGSASIVENGGVTLAITPLLPTRQFGWRVNDVTRTSIYPDEEYHAEYTHHIRYRGFAPFRAADSFEFLFGLKIGGTGVKDWDFATDERGWRLGIPELGRTLIPDETGLAVR